MEDLTSKSWFAVFNNPVDHGYEGTPEEICERLCDEWIADVDSRTCAVSYCVSADGLNHCHMVLCDSKTMRFSLIKKTYAIGMHFEPTKGSKQQANDYIEKRGKFAEKGESVLYIARRGEIRGSQGKRTDLETAFELVKDGLTPLQILEIHPNLYRYETSVKKMYYNKREKETPIIREVKTIWHTGESGSGKSYSRIALADEVGEDNIYYLTDYGNGMFDGYNGQKYLWIEDFKGEMRFGDLLRVLDVYKADIHCRYANAKSLWSEIHITSIFHPVVVYRRMLDDDFQKDDKIEQLLRRITFVRYHYKHDSEYKYRDYEAKISIREMYLDMLDEMEKMVDGPYKIKKEQDIPVMKCPERVKI